MMYSELLDRLAAISSLGNQFHIRLSGQKRGYALPE
jgi:hypothetical protein